MTYSCSDFTDTILDALKIEVPEESWDSPSDQADLALEAIEKLQKAAKLGEEPADDVARVKAALAHLRIARDLLVQAGAKRSADRVRLAITSAGGAERHARSKRYL